ncbi:hypothetical protein GO755_19780 [Spirosoma sp. HMF4905]|uniref:Uncharacterized protein n=1 Tax=Spirosoma arboris TaxID=2682092 RepID=A0A7K1SEQ5_9BACT|nr:hypothetical protein [Spirosoma arboris]MVM32297.1 hypothetical protein [Spirosoma arboris]
MRYYFLLATLITALQASAQLSVSSQGITIKANTPLSVDGLVLTPSVELTLANNTLQKSTTPVSTTPQSSISRVYQFSVVVSFSGTVRFTYLTTELNSNTEARLKLAYAATSSGPFFNSPASTLNTTTKTISTTFTNQNLQLITAASQYPDLSPTILLPDANFPISSSRNFVINIFEVAGVPTSQGNAIVTLTAPVGYSLSFNNSLATINVSGGATTVVNNTQWSIIQNQGNQQITLRMNTGQSVGAGDTSVLGFTISRTTANSGSVSNVTTNVAEDASKTYDGDAANNVYARVISGL